MLFAVIIAPFFLLAAYRLGYRSGVETRRAHLVGSIRGSLEACDVLNRLATESTSDRDEWSAQFRDEFPHGLRVEGPVPKWLVDELRRPDNGSGVECSSSGTVDANRGPG